MSFILSIVLHLGLIYSIPAVDLFSEDGGEVSSEMIIVDLIQEEMSDAQQEFPQPVYNQFLASSPEPNHSSDEVTTQTSTKDDEVDIPLPTTENFGEHKWEYVLVTNASSPEPEMKQFQKRLFEKQPAPTPKSTPERQHTEKLAPQPEPPKVINPPRDDDMIAKSSVTSLQIDNSRKPEKPEESLQFPLMAHQPNVRQVPSSGNFPAIQLTFGKRPVKDLESKVNPSNLPLSLQSSLSQKRQFGISKKDERDQNQFGIFAGKKFEEPQIKETVQEAVVSEEKNPATPTEKLVEAKVLGSEGQIEGPVKGRKIIRRPPSPQVNVDIDVEFKLKFWVLPDGTIGEVIPLKRGDARLERIAIAYLKEWQFEPLPSNVSQQKIWGTISIKFTVQ